MATACCHACSPRGLFVFFLTKAMPIPNPVFAWCDFLFPFPSCVLFLLGARTLPSHPPPSLLSWPVRPASSFPWSFSLPSRLHVIPQLIPEIPALLALQTTQEEGTINAIFLAEFFPKFRLSWLHTYLLLYFQQVRSLPNSVSRCQYCKWTLLFSSCSVWSILGV